MSMIKKLKIAFYTLMSGVNINLVGQFRASEFLVLFTFPFSFKKDDFKHYPYLKKIVYALLLLLFFQLFSDLFVIHNSTQNMLRGSAAIIMALLSFIVLFKVLDDEKAIMLYIFFMVIKNIVFTDEIIDSDMSYFKFKIAPILSNIVYLLLYYFYKRGNLKMALGVMVTYSIVCLANDSRSTAMTFLIAAVIIYLFNTVNVTRQKIIVFSILGAVLFQCAYIFYVKSVLSHELGGAHSIGQLQRLDNPYNPFELLITGRGETFVALAAIGDAPWFGHGSWAEDKNLKYYKMLLALHDDDMNIDKATEKERLIPSHSIIMGAWVNHGAGGFLATLLVFIYLMRMGFYLIRNGQSLALYPVLVILSIGLIWIFLFSPFQQLRFNVPAIGAIILSSYYNLKQQEEAGYEDEEEEDAAEQALTGELVKN